MRKLLLMSVLIGTFWIPIAAVRDPKKRNIPQLRKRFAIFCGIWVFCIIYVLPRL
jgi:hypothetical protein